MMCPPHIECCRVEHIWDFWLPHRVTAPPLMPNVFTCCLGKISMWKKMFLEIHLCMSYRGGSQDQSLSTMKDGCQEKLEGSPKDQGLIPTLGTAFLYSMSYMASGWHSPSSKIPPMVCLSHLFEVGTLLVYLCTSEMCCAVMVPLLGAISHLQTKYSDSGKKFVVWGSSPWSTWS